MVLKFINLPPEEIKRIIEQEAEYQELMNDDIYLDSETFLEILANNQKEDLE